MKQNSVNDSERYFIPKVEEYFSEFVEFYGGKVIDKLDGNLADRPNADYLFENPELIAELKCFEKDIFSGKDEFPKMERLLTKWTNKKMITVAQLREYTFRGAPLPIECRKDMVQVASKTIERAIHKGNKQIEVSKSTFDKPNSNGVLFLVNDGNYFFTNEHFLGIIGNILGRKYRNPSFDVIVYLTINQTSQIPKSPYDYTVWVPIYTRIDKNGETIKDEKLFDFINDIGRKFAHFYELKSGENIKDNREFSDTEKGIEEIKKHKYIPKKIIYGK
jgi:hypothetical protein